MNKKGKGRDARFSGACVAETPFGSLLTDGFDAKYIPELNGCLNKDMVRRDGRTQDCARTHYL